MTYDVVIVGSGPAGLAAGVRAARRGIRHVVLERGVFASTIARYRKGKLVMAEPASVALHAELGIEFREDSREATLERWQRDCERAGVELRVGPDFEVTGIEGERGAFRVQTRGGQSFAARFVVLAIGTSGAPRPFEVPGEDLPHVVFEIEDASAYVDRQIVVVGAGDSAIEDALALAESDNDVVVIQRRAGFDRAKPLNRSAIEAASRGGEIQVHSHSTVRRFEPGVVYIDAPNEELCLSADLVIGRLGARPPRAFLESLGIRFESPDPEALPSVSESYESNVPGLYLVGELVGRPLIKHCLNQGYEVIDLILGHEVRSADEPLLREILEPLAISPDTFVREVRGRIPLLADLTRRQIESWLAESHIERLGAREIVYEAGDFGETLFTIWRGAVEIEREAPEDDAPSSRRAPPTLLHEGDFFGEDALFSGRGRCESAVTTRPTVLIETSRTAVLRLASSVEAIGHALDRAWTLRKLAELFPMLLPAACARLAERAELRTYAAGDALFHEGDASDGLYLVRRGSLVVSRERAGVDRVVNYVSAGSMVGELALARPSLQRTATVRATVRTETLRISLAAMQEILQAYPELRTDYAKRWRELAVRDERVLATPGSTSLLDFVIAQGGKEATDLLYIDESLCIRCDNCEKACAATHSGVSRLDREAGPRFAGIHLPTSCQHCENALCMTDCPPGAIQRHPDGEIYIDPTCIGCGNCVAYCSYGVIQLTELHDVRRPSLLRSILFGATEPRRLRKANHGAPAHDIAVKCDLCRDLQHRAAGAPVACVAACPTGAIARIAPLALLERLSEARPRSYTIEDRGSSYASPASPPASRVASSPPDDVRGEQVRLLLDKARTLEAGGASEELTRVLYELAEELQRSAEST